MFFRAFNRLLRRDPPPGPLAGELLRDLGRVEALPVLSDTAVRAMALMHDPDSTLADVGDLIRRDGALVAAVLKLANSAACGGLRPVESARAAVVRLGLRGCYRVVAAVGVRRAFGRADGGPAEALLRHALFTGTLAARLSAAGRLGFRGEEFTAGLLHDIGRVVLCARAPDAFARLDPLTFREDATTPDGERAALGTDHCEIGGRFAEVNGLPPAVAAAVRRHHTPDGAEYPVLVALTAAADELANHAQRERNLTAFRPDRAPGFRLLPGLVGEHTAAAVRRAVPAAVVDSLRETRAMLRVTA